MVQISLEYFLKNSNISKCGNLNCPYSNTKYNKDMFLMKFVHRRFFIGICHQFFIGSQKVHRRIVFLDDEKVYCRI